MRVFQKVQSKWNQKDKFILVQKVLKSVHTSFIIYIFYQHLAGSLDLKISGFSEALLHSARLIFLSTLVYWLLLSDLESL